MCICGARKLHDPIQHALQQICRERCLASEYGRIAVDTQDGQSTSHSYGEWRIPFILFVRDKQTAAEMQQLAEENEILLLRCRQSMFRVCGELYKAGLLPVY